MNAQIQDLADKGVLHAVMKDWAQEVRLLANESAHPEAPVAIVVTPEDAKDIVHFLDLLLLYLCDFPKQIELV